MKVVAALWPSRALFEDMREPEGMPKPLVAEEMIWLIKDCRRAQ